MQQGERGERKARVAWGTARGRSHSHQSIAIIVSWVHAPFVVHAHESLAQHELAVTALNI